MSAFDPKRTFAVRTRNINAMPDFSSSLLRVKAGYNADGARMTGAGELKFAVVIVGIPSALAVVRPLRRRFAC